MYVPPYESVLASLRATPERAEAEGLTIPVGLLKLLLQIALAHSDFDEEIYLRANPDVRGAMELGRIESGRVHYIGYGYFEGRSGGLPEVDEAWYLAKYPDVAAAIDAGKVGSAAQHFQIIGAGEGRSPNADQEENAAAWKASLHGV